MRLQEIWRYPVKSMAGESLTAADLTEAGVAGDRIVQVRKAAGRIVSARTRPLLLRHHATLGPGNQVLVDGRPWTSEDVARDVEAAAGAGARLVQSELEDRFDILPPLVTTAAASGRIWSSAALPGLSERQWEGARLRIGAVVIGMRDLRSRCVMTTFDPDSGQQDLGVLQRVQREFNGRLGLNGYVVAPGRVSAGDEVELIPPS
jgi:uncharacterized protein